jgi:hypothetical protein
LLPPHATATRSADALNQGALETLMVPLAVVVRDEFLHRSSEMRFSHRNVYKKNAKSVAVKGVQALWRDLAGRSGRFRNWLLAAA